MSQALANGRAFFWLEGKKLRGGYTLTRFGKPADKRWLLVKALDAEADFGSDPLIEQPASVLTGRTLEEIAASK